jgi:hypothetical protein
MQAIFPISMIIAILAAIGIAFLLPSLIFPMKVNIPEVQPFGHTLVSNWGRTGAVASLNPNGRQAIVKTPQGLAVANVTQAIVETTQGPVLATVVETTPPASGLPEINKSSQAWINDTNSVRRTGQFLEDLLQQKTGKLPTGRYKPSRKQRRSRRN